MIVLVAIVVLAAVAALAVWLKKELADLRASSGQQLSAQLSERNADVDRRLANVVETMDRRLGDFDQRVDHRLESAARTATAIHQQLGKIGETNTQMLDRAKDLARLEQALRPPKARGGFGELLLGNLLADTFPRDKYELQYGFRSGERVDAVIRLDRSLVPVDAKFPLDNFTRLIEAEDEAGREQHAKQFVRDVKAHVDAIADKYIRPDEGTYEFSNTSPSRPGFIRTYCYYKGTAETTGTSPVYHDLLKRLQEPRREERAPHPRVDRHHRRHLGGGMNGVCLARAVAGDRSQESLTEAWLAEAGIGQLLAPQLTAELPAGRRVYPHLKRVYPPIDLTTPPEKLPKRAGTLGLAWHGLWSAAYSIRPAIRLASNFPPSALDGSKMTTLVTNALHGMKAREGGIGCLLPGEHPLDLYVTTTDFSGAAQLVPIEHRLVGDTRFRTVLHFESGRAGVKFPLDGEEHVPMICFAARATASFPGAFPPISLDTFDANTSWDALVGHFFRQYMLDGETPVDVRGRRFFDGGVLDNWPFDHARSRRSVTAHADGRGRSLALSCSRTRGGRPRSRGRSPPGWPRRVRRRQGQRRGHPVSQSWGMPLSGLREHNEKCGREPEEHRVELRATCATASSGLVLASSHSRRA